MSTLYIVATPIGNMEDITLRALRILAEADVIFAEDTRVTGKLLERHEIKTSLKRLDANVEGEMAEEVEKIFDEYETIALVTDAGTPTISDPGYRFVHAAHEAGIEVVTIPGASALTAALSISGVPSDQFTFLGFLPHKKGRKTKFKEIAESDKTIVFYESPHRILKTLASLEDVLDEKREVVIARELTKMHEEVVRGSSAQIKAFFEEHSDKVRGEFVVIINA